MTSTNDANATPSSEKWCIGLPPYNQLVVAYMVGSKEHSDLTWYRDGWAFMVRHDDPEHTVDDQWARDRYREALRRLDADHLVVKQWTSLERPS